MTGGRLLVRWGEVWYGADGQAARRVQHALGLETAQAWVTVGGDGADVGSAAREAWARIAAGEVRP